MQNTSATARASRNRPSRVWNSGSRLGAPTSSFSPQVSSASATTPATAAARSTVTPPRGSAPRVHEDAGGRGADEQGQRHVEQPAPGGGEGLAPAGRVHELDDHRLARRLPDAEGERPGVHVAVDGRDRTVVDRVGAVGERRRRQHLERELVAGHRLRRRDARHRRAVRAEHLDQRELRVRRLGEGQHDALPARRARTRSPRGSSSRARRGPPRRPAERPRRPRPPAPRRGTARLRRAASSAPSHPATAGSRR